MREPLHPLASRPARGQPAAGSPAARGRVLVLGIGNVLLGDEGVGVHAVRRLEREPLPPGVQVLDGGTGGLHLLSCLTEHAALVVLDATIDGKPAGSVSRLYPRYAADYPRTLVAHDIGFKDLLDAAQVLGARPRVALVTVSIGSLGEMSLELSAPVAAALPRAIAAVHEELAEFRRDGLPAA
jgi:hydrogenase maturation protease